MSDTPPVPDATSADAPEPPASERLRGLERSRDDLARRNRELEDFVWHVGHDLKNGLFTIRTFIDVYLEDAEEARDMAPGVHQTCDHLMDFVQRMLLMAQAGRVIGAREPTDLGAMIRRVFEDLGGADLDAELVLETPLPAVKVDPLALERLLHCLLENCVQYRAPDRRLMVRLAASLDGPRVVLRLRDNGIGLRPESRERLFTPMFSEEDRRFAGFGLAIVKKLVEGHGGRVAASSPGPGEGFEVVLDLPVA